MSYTFRIRFTRSPTDAIQTELPVWIVPTKQPGISVYLRARKDDQPIKDSDYLLLVGDGYSSDVEAQRSGDELQDALMLALARVRVGADFGERAAKSMYTECGLAWVERQIGQRVLNNVHGLMVFASEPEPKFVQSSADLTRGVRFEFFQQAFQRAIELHPIFTSREKLAFLLFNSSFFQRAADSRFLLLVMAVEALLDPEPRADEARKHVDTLIAQTSASSLNVNEKNSLIGSLQLLKKESISHAGRRLASARLGGRSYDSKLAPDFFTYCYRLRSKLVHGSFPIPSFGEIGAAAANLEVFVSDILTSELLSDVN